MAVFPIEVDPTAARTDLSKIDREEKDSRAREKDGSAVSASDPTSVAAAVAANRAIKIDDRSIEFSYNEDINRVIVRVRSNDTDEIVREIPPKEYVQFLSRFKEAVGVLFDETA